MSEIGDKAKLRRIADILLADSGQMLPSEVNIDEWQPVISYGIDVDDQSYFAFQQGPTSLAGVSGLTQSFGSGGGAPGLTMPGGFIYHSKYIDFLVSFGAAPINDEKLRLNISQVFFDIPGVGTNRTIVIMDMAPEDQQPYIRLRAAQTQYRITYPVASMGTVLPSGLEQIRHIEAPNLIIPCPTSLTQPGRSIVQYTIAYNTVAGVPKNFPALSTITTDGFFKKVPTTNFNMDGV